MEEKFFEKYVMFFSLGFLAGLMVIVLGSSYFIEPAGQLALILIALVDALMLFKIRVGFGQAVYSPKRHGIIEEALYYSEKPCLGGFGLGVFTVLVLMTIHFMLVFG